LLAVASSAWHSGSIKAMESEMDDHLNAKHTVGTRSGIEFENEVAEAYRALGADVEHEIAAAL
jgi:hypothetical protein